MANRLSISLSTIAVAALLAGCTDYAQSADPTQAKVTEPTTAKVIRKDLVGYAFFDGKVVTPPGVTATVTSPYPITVGEVMTAIGKRVSKGQTIIRLSAPDVTANLSTAQANVAAAKSAYEAARSANDSQVREAKVILDQARAAERAARDDIQNGGTADLEAATQARIAAELALQDAEGQLAAAVLSEKQALDMANEYLKEAKQGAAVTNVRAPITGTVMSLEAKPGLQANAKDLLATITDLQALKIQGVVPPEHADLVKKGTRLIIALDGQNSDPIEGEVTEVTILPPSDGQTSEGYLAVVKFDNAKGVVTPSSTIKRLGVRTGKAENVIVVPIGAVETDGQGRPSVRIDRNGKWESVPVETGLTDGALIEIKSGLQEGDVVRVNPVVIES